MDSEEERRKFLLEIYKQLFNDIDRHFKVIWQAAGVLIAAFAILALTEKNVIPLDVAVSLMIVVVGWFVAHLVDASYWYNRNLAMIANIERQFLTKGDLREIHFYFGKHREQNKPIWQIKIQFWFGAVLAGLVLLFHFLMRVAPGLREPWSNFEPMRALPYIFAVVCVWFVAVLRKDRNLSFGAFIKNSPGIPVDISEIDYTAGQMKFRDWLWPFGK